MDETPVTRAEVLGLFEAMKHELLNGVQELVRSAQTDIMRMFLEFHEGSHVRIRAIELKFSSNDVAVNERLSILERRLAEIEKRLMLELPGLMASGPKTPLQ
jgi:hypothetical protein